LSTSITRRPPCGIASRALTARFSTEASSWLMSISTHQMSSALRIQLHQLAQCTLQHVLHVQQALVEVGCLAVQRLASGKRQQALGEAGGTATPFRALSRARLAIAPASRAR
jgi:hypothetical protein